MGQLRAGHEWPGVSEQMFRDMGDLFAHVSDDIAIGAFEMPKDPNQEELIYTLPDNDEEDEEEGDEEMLVLVLLSPEEARAILNAAEENDEDRVIRQNAWNP